MLVEALQFLDHVVPVADFLHPLPDLLPEKSGKDAREQEGRRVRHRRTGELGKRDRRPLDPGGQEDPAHLQVDEDGVRHGGKERPAHRSAQVPLEAPEQDHDNEHEGEDAVVQARREDDDGDERDVHDGLEENGVRREIHASPRCVPEKQPPVGEKNGEVQKLEPAREQQFRGADLH